MAGNLGDGTVSVLLGRGDGSFQTPITVTVGGNPQFIGQGDFNADGRLDIVVASTRTGTIYVLLGRGDGSFQPANAYVVAGTPQTVAVADFDSDGNLDIVASNNTTNYYSILLGNGDGTFRPPRNSAPGTSGLTSVVVAELNGDGKPDLVVTNEQNASVGVLIRQWGRANVPGGADVSRRQPAADSCGERFQWRRPRRPGSRQFECRRAQRRERRHTHRSWRQSQHDSVADHAGRDSGVGRAGAVASKCQPAVSAGSVAFYDGATALGSSPLLNGSASLSVRFSSTGTRSLRAQYSGAVVYGNAARAWTAASRRPRRSWWQLRRPRAISNSTTFDPEAMTHKELRLAISTAMATPMWSWRTRQATQSPFFRGMGGEAFTQSALISGFSLPEGVAVGDFNSDGALDIAVANLRGGAVSALLGNGDLTFRAARNYAVDPSPLALVTADFDGDGRADIAVAGGGLSVLLSNSSGSFKPAIKIPVASNFSAISMLTGDYNGDGIADLAITSQGIAVLLGVGDGTFGSQQIYKLSPNDVLGALAQADFTGDGVADFAVCSQSPLGGSRITVFPGAANGTFGVPATLPGNLTCSRIAAGDFNGDGKPDIAFTTAFSGVTLLQNDGTGGFQTPRLTGFRPSPRT